MDVVKFSKAWEYLINTPVEEMKSGEFRNGLDVVKGFMKEGGVGLAGEVLSRLGVVCYKLSKLQGGRRRFKGQDVGELVEVLGWLLQKVGEAVGRDGLVVLLQGVLSLTKTELNSKEKGNELLGVLARVGGGQIVGVLAKSKEGIRQIYPKVYSVCSQVIRSEKLGTKGYASTLTTMQILIQKSPTLWNGNIEQDKFVAECLKRLNDDMKYIVDRYSTYQTNKQLKIASFAEFIVAQHCRHQTKEENQMDLLLQNFNSDLQSIGPSTRDQLFSNIILLCQLCQVPASLQSYSRLQQSTINTLDHQRYLLITKDILSLQANSTAKNQLLSQLTHLLPFINVNPHDNTPHSQFTLDLLSRIFRIRKQHVMITIPHHATNIPLPKLTHQTTQQNYGIGRQALQREHEAQYYRSLAQTAPFFELQPSLVAVTHKMLEAFTAQTSSQLIGYYYQQLIEQEYSLDMSVTALYSHLTTLFTLRALTRSNVRAEAVAEEVFRVLANKSQVLKSLKPTYVEEQLLVSCNLEIMGWAYQRMKEAAFSQNAMAKIRQTQNSVLLLQKTLNQLQEQSYLIRLATTLSLLAFPSSPDQPLHSALLPLQATIIHRNRNHPALLTSLLQLARLLPQEYTQLAQHYLSSPLSSSFLATLIPHLTPQTARKCVLGSSQWWVVLSKGLVHLNNQPLEPTSSNQHFYVSEGSNVKVRNALGVVAIELGGKWKQTLRSTRRETIVDLMRDMCKTNFQMVFFRGFFDELARQMAFVLKECLGEENNKGESGRQVQFYLRLKVKIISFLRQIPAQNHLQWAKSTLKYLLQALNSYNQVVRMQWLFNNDVTRREEYNILNQLIERYTPQIQSDKQ